MTKVLILGSEGSLMQAVISQLPASVDIVGVDNLFRHHMRPGRATREYQFVQTDASDSWSMNNIMNNAGPFDFIIQGAARIYGVGGFNKYCADILSKDVALHTNILDLAVKHSVKKVVYISSSMVYEKCPQDKDISVSEEMPDEYPAPETEYGLSKYVGEKLSQAYFKQHGLKYTIWRPFNIITPYETSDGEVGMSHVFADYIHNILGEKLNPLPIIDDGEQIRCFTYIDDVAKAIADNSFSEKTDNMIFNLGNPEPISMKELAYSIWLWGSLTGMLGNEELQFNTVAEYDNDVRVRIPDITLARNYLKFEPKVKLNESLMHCINHYVRGLKW